MVTIEASREITEERKDAHGNILSKKVFRETFEKPYTIEKEYEITNMKGSKAILSGGTLTITIPARKRDEVKKEGSVKVTVTDA